MSHLITKEDSMSREWDFQKSGREIWKFPGNRIPFVRLVIEPKIRCNFCERSFPMVFKFYYSPGGYPYIKPRDYCWKCMVGAEQGHIEGLLKHELPLSINHIWVTWVGEHQYRRLLSGLKLEHMTKVFYG